MYTQHVSFHQDLLPYVKKSLRELYDSYNNCDFKIIQEGHSYSIIIEGNNGEEFNRAVTQMTSIIFKLTETNEFYRIKKKLEKERIHKRKLLNAAIKIEQNVIKQQEHNAHVKVDTTTIHNYYVNGERSTNPSNYYFGLELDVDR